MSMFSHLGTSDVFLRANYTEFVIQRREKERESIVIILYPNAIWWGPDHKKLILILVGSGVDAAVLKSRTIFSDETVIDMCF